MTKDQWDSIYRLFPDPTEDAGLVGKLTVVEKVDALHSQRQYMIDTLTAIQRSNIRSILNQGELFQLDLALTKAREKQNEPSEASMRGMDSTWKDL